MAQNWSNKQLNFVSRFSSAVVAFLAAADTLNALCTEFAADGYGTGGPNALTDANVQQVLPAATALHVAEAEGIFAGPDMILSTVASNRGYLEMMRT